MLNQPKAIEAFLWESRIIITQYISQGLFFCLSWNTKMGSNCCRCFDLFQPVIEIYMRKVIQGRMLKRVRFSLIVLNLQPGRYSLLTEGNLIPSATADYELWG
jgi:hypothetical protein